MSKASKIDITRINAIAELERVGVAFNPASENELLLHCPMHDDTNASCYLNTSKNMYICHACKGKGDIIAFLAHTLKQERKTVIADLSTRYDLGACKIVNPKRIEEWHQAIYKAGPLLTALYDRGVSDDVIRLARIGYADGRITIPIYNANNQAINVRKYLPGAPGHLKMRNVPGMQSTALYPITDLKYDTVWLCGGELKALVAGMYLHFINVGAIAVTGGEGTWALDFTKLLAGKTVYICMDVDAAGVAAAQRLAAQLHNSCTVYVIQLPLSVAEVPKGDLNDWVRLAKPSVADFEQLMSAAPKYTLEATADDAISTEVLNLHLSQVCSAEHVGRLVECDVIISALDENPYLLPKLIEVTCTKDQSNCAFCPFMCKDADVLGTFKDHVKVNASSIGVVEMVSNPPKMHEDAIKTALRIPHCKAVKFKVIARRNVMDVRLVPPLHTFGTHNEHLVQPALVTTKDIELNTPYRVRGRVYPHPRNQQSIFLVFDVQKSSDSLSHFSCDLDKYEELCIFRPVTWTTAGLEEVLEQIYSDYEANITRIYERRRLHIAIDLCFHSSLHFKLDSTLQNGWVNTLILGDSSQGKSEATLRLLEFYDLGVRSDCKNATVAGLLGGLQQLGTRWFVTWGVIPTHDRRLVVLEEVKGTSPEVLGKLTDMRSSGVAELSKIEKRKSHARTRLLFISNPRSDRPIAAYNFGIEAIRELMGSLEDVRRFDMAVILAASQVDTTRINELSVSGVDIPHKYTAEMSKRLVLRSWTRSVNQIRFEPAAVTACLRCAVSLCDTFSEALPLCDRGTTRYKLARLAIALANKTFSTDDTFEVTVVRECHIEYVFNYLMQEYSEPTFGYKDFSQAQKFANQVTSPNLIIKKILSTKHPNDFVKQLLHTDEINLVDIMDWCELERDLAQQVLSFLVRKHAVYRRKSHYIKTSEFIALLKRMSDNGVTQQATIHNTEEF